DEARASEKDHDALAAIEARRALHLERDIADPSAEGPHDDAVTTRQTLPHLVDGQLGVAEDRRMIWAPLATHGEDSPGQNDADATSKRAPPAFLALATLLW